jgi:hypothetical protein
METSEYIGLGVLGICSFAMGFYVIRGYVQAFRENREMRRRVKERIKQLNIGE